jgi:hypothetical protein
MRQLFFLLAFALLCACTTRDTLADSKSNWLRRCDTANDCTSGAQCACGVCTRACSSARACGAEHESAVCVEPREEGLPSACEPALSAAPGICLAACTSDAECGGTLRCQQGVCVGISVDVERPSRDAGEQEAPMDAASEPPQEDATQAAPSDASTTANPEAAQSDAQQPTSTRIEVDCRPRYDIVGAFGSSCQYALSGDLPMIVCPHLASVAVGSLVLTIRHPDRVRVGERTPLGGTDPAVSIESSFANSEILVGTTGAASGSLIFDELRVGEIIRGRFSDVRLTFQPTPPFECSITSGAFVADWGPGVRDM